MTDFSNLTPEQYRALLELGVQKAQEAQQQQQISEYLRWDAEQVAAVRKAIPEFGQTDPEFRRSMAELRQWVIEERGVAPEVVNSSYPSADTVVAYWKARQAQRRKQIEADRRLFGRSTGAGHNTSDDENLDHALKILGIEEQVGADDDVNARLGRLQGIRGF